MKHLFVVLLYLLPFSLSAFEVELPIPSGIVNQIALKETYYLNTSGWERGKYADKPLETPLDTIDLGKFGSLYLVLVDQVTIMEDEGVSLLLFHQSPAGETLKVGPSKDNWGCDTIGDTFASVDSVFEYRRYYFEEGSWADTTTALHFPLWEYSHQLWDVQDPYEEYLLWGKATLLIEAKDGEWLKLRFTKDHFQYITSDSETGDFPYNTNVLGSTIPLRYINDSLSGETVELYAYDDVTKQTLLYLDIGWYRSWSYTIPLGKSSIITRCSDVWVIDADSTTGFYTFKNSYPVDMIMDEMDDDHYHTMTNGYDPFFYFGKENQIAIDSLSRDSLWGINEKIIYEGDRGNIHEVSMYDTIAIALEDRVHTVGFNETFDTLNLYELTELFVGETIDKEPVHHIKVHLFKDISVPIMPIQNKITPGKTHTIEKIKLVSLNGRVLKEFETNYRNLHSKIETFALPSGMYIIQTPSFTEKIRIK